MKLANNIKFILLSFLLTVLVACEKAKEHSFAGSTMGTQYSIKYVSSALIEVDQNILRQKVDARLDEIENLMSTYRPESEINTFNRLSINERFILSDDFHLVLKRSLDLAAKSEGRFDPTVAPLVNLWGFGPSGEVQDFPKVEEIEFVLKEKVGYQYLNFEEVSKSLLKKKPVTLDLSAIAKGYAVDELAVLLEEQGVENFLVEIGGEIKVAGRKADHSLWVLAIENPSDDAREVYETFAVTDIAVATSGNYRNYFIKDGKRYSHTINPLTGMPVEHDLASVSVFMASAMDADGVATMLSVLGPVEGFDFAKDNNIAALFISRDNDGKLVQNRTPALSAYER